MRCKTTRGRARSLARRFFIALFPSPATVRCHAVTATTYCQVQRERHIELSLGFLPMGDAAFTFRRYERNESVLPFTPDIFTPLSVDNATTACVRETVHLRERRAMPMSVYYMRLLSISPLSSSSISAHTQRASWRWQVMPVTRSTLETFVVWRNRMMTSPPAFFSTSDHVMPGFARFTRCLDIHARRTSISTPDYASYGATAGKLSAKKADVDATHRIYTRKDAVFRYPPYTTRYHCVDCLPRPCWLARRCCRYAISPRDAAASHVHR